MSSITHKHGSEGPKHDPYGYEEITVNRSDGRRVTIHYGLGVWARSYHADGRLSGMSNDAAADKLFEKVAGIAPHFAERALKELRERRYRFHQCGNKYLKDVNGYPGETLTVCGRCGAVIDSEFDISAVA